MTTATKTVKGPSLADLAAAAAWDFATPDSMPRGHAAYVAVSRAAKAAAYEAAYRVAAAEHGGGWLASKVAERAVEDGIQLAIAERRRVKGAEIRAVLDSPEYQARLRRSRDEYGG